MIGTGLFIVKSRIEGILFSMIMGFSTIIYILPNIFFTGINPDIARFVIISSMSLIASIKLRSYIKYERNKKVLNPLI